MAASLSCACRSRLSQPRSPVLRIMSSSVPEPCSSWQARVSSKSTWSLTNGFFFLDEVADHDLIRVTAKDLRYKSHRAVVGRDLTSLNLLTFPLVGSDLTVGVPRATGILEARGRYQFFQGGLRSRRSSSHISAPCSHIGR
jgi:hypothetical protein